MTGSPILVGDTVITGVSAAGANVPGRDLPRRHRRRRTRRRAQLLWESFSLPDNGGQPGGYAGATMFSAPAVDVAGRARLRHVRATSTRSRRRWPPATRPSPNGFFSESCEQPGAFWDSIVAFNLTTGAPVWSYRVVGDAPWHRVCDCQPVPGACRRRHPIAGLSGSAGSATRGTSAARARTCSSSDGARSSASARRAASTTCSTRRRGVSSGTRSSARAATRAASSGERRTTAAASTSRSRTSTTSRTS